jgi:hypothetical protein
MNMAVDKAGEDVMLDTGCWMLDTGYWMLGTGCWMLDTGYWILDVGAWRLVGYFCYSQDLSIFNLDLTVENPFINYINYVPTMNGHGNF